MAKGKSKKAHLSLRQVWTDLKSQAWMSELCEKRPAGQWREHGGSIKGRCPWHDDSTASFVVTPSKGIAKCFGCSRTFLHPVKFLAAVREISFTEALVHLRKIHGMRSAIPESLFEKAQAWERHQNYKQQIADLFCDQLFLAMTNYPQLGEQLYAKTAVQYLMERKLGVSAPVENARQEPPVCEADPAGVWAGITANKLVGIVPPLPVVENYFKDKGDPEGFDFYRKYMANAMDQKYIGSLALLYYDGPDSVARFKLRVPVPEKPTIWIDDEFKDDLGDFRGFFGLNYYKTYIGGRREEGTQIVDHNIIAYVSEGEFDALSAIARQIRSTSDDYMALAASGAGVQPLDSLTAFGVQRVRIVQDNDKGGQEFIKNCIDRTNTEKLTLHVFNWPDEYTKWRDPQDPSKSIKDPDEAIKTLGYPKWARYVRTESCYQPAFEWVFEYACRRIDAFTPDRVTERFREAAAAGRWLKHSEECRMYCAAIAKSYDIDQQNLFRDIRSREEDEDGFIKRLGQVFCEYFFLVGIEKGESRKRLLHIWHKESRTQDLLILNDERHVEAVVAKYFGTIHEFVRHSVGDPAFLTGEGEDANMGVEERRTKYRSYLNLALLGLTKGLPSLEYAERRAQGLHYISTNKGEMRSYLVNGKDVYKIVHTETDMNVERLEGPSDQSILFETHEGGWLPTLEQPEDLKAEVDVVELFKNLREMISTGWAWKAQNLDPTFLAAYCMCLPVMSVFSRQTAIMLNAEAQSGKSRFVSGFIGGTGFPTIHMVPAAKALQGYTAASIRSQWDGCSLALCLEEFEDTGGMDKKSNTVRNVLELTRDLISENFVDVSIGTTAGTVRKFKLRFPLICAAIRPLRDAASLSRFVVFELIKDESRIDPVIALVERWGDEGLAQMRHQLSIGLVKHMPRLRQLQREIEREFATGQSLPAHVPSRFREAMYPILTMLRFIAEQPGGAALVDYKQFAWEFGDSRRDQLTRLRTTSENEQLFESVLSSMFQIDREDVISRVTNIRTMLCDLNNLGEINKTHKGVFFDAKNEWLVVQWIEAAQGVLANTRYRGEAPPLLKQVSERSPHHVKTEDARNARVIERLIDVMGPGHKYDLVSVFTVKHLLDDARRSKEIVKPPTKTDPEPTKKLDQDAGDKPVALDDDMIT